jgi:hypothetical protein
VLVGAQSADFGPLAARVGRIRADSMPKSAIIRHGCYTHRGGGGVLVAKESASNTGVITRLLIAMNFEAAISDGQTQVACSKEVMRMRPR